MADPTAGLWDAADALRRGDISSRILTEALLARGKAAEPLHAFTCVAEPQALALADASDRRRAAGKACSALDGAPLAHKDNLATAALPTTACSRLLQDWRPQRDAEVVDVLARAGAVGLGKLACYEFAFAGPSLDLPRPPPVNPWAADRSTAGSSSGSAVAVAAGLALAATGTDTGGSVRDPAALCGVVGLKPTYDRLSRAGLLPFSPSLDHVGLLARTARDCALAYFTTVAEGAPEAVPPQMDALEAPPGALRVGVLVDWHEREQPCRPETLQGLERVVEALRLEGADVRRAVLPPLADFHACGWAIALAELYGAHAAWLRNGDGGARYGGLLRSGLAVGAAVTAPDYLAALARKAELTSRMREVLERFDLLVTAVQAGEAPLLDQVLGQLPFEKVNYTMPFNVTGSPALSLPTGLGPHGLPLAVQLVAAAGREPLLLRVAHALQRGGAVPVLHPPA